MPRSELDPDSLRALQAIRRILRSVSAHSRTLARETGLSVPQILCLQTLDERGDAELTVADVADALHLSRPTVSVLVDRLVRAGLVTRDRSERDRRRVCLGLTDAGRDRLHDMPPPLQDRFVANLARLRPAERAEILASLEAVVVLMDADALDAAPLLHHGVDVSD